MSAVQQPGAREQYDSWIKYPNTYRKPSDLEWVASYDALRATVARLREALELIADATDAPCTCGAGCEEIAAAAIAAVEGEK